MKKQYILCLDTETTDFARPILLDGKWVNSVDHSTVLQVAFVLLDTDLNELTRNECFIQWDKPLESMNKDTYDFHVNNGFVERYENEPLLSMSDACDMLIQSIEDVTGKLESYKYSNDVELILAGKSIWFDRAYLTKHMPQLIDKVSHQMIDTSAMKPLFRSTRPGIRRFTHTASTHMAMDDSLSAMTELKELREMIDMIPVTSSDTLSDAITSIYSKKTVEAENALQSLLDKGHEISEIYLESVVYNLLQNTYEVSDGTNLKNHEALMYTIYARSGGESRALIDLHSKSRSKVICDSLNVSLLMIRNN